MIVEVAQITIDPTRADAFVAAVEQAKPTFLAATGCHGVRLEQQIEDAGCFALRVLWNTVDDHMVTFRASPGFQQWRTLAGPFFVAPPVVSHYHAAGDCD